MMLSEKETAFLTCLERVNDNTLWGQSIADVVSANDPVKFRTLVTELKSQAQDSPPVMISILGEPCYQQLMAL